MAILRNDTTVRSADGQTTSPIITAANIGNYGISTTSTYYIGTTQNVFNRASGAQTLTGVSIDGNAATVTNGVYTTGTQTIGGAKTFSDGITVNTATYNTFTKPSPSTYQTVALFGSTGGGLFLTTDNPIIGVGAYYNTSWIATATSGRQIDFANGNFTFSAFSGATIGGAASWGTVAQLNSSGTFSATGDFRAPIFYDTNNTAYYCDPASVSNLNAVTLNRSGSDGYLTLPGSVTVSNVSAAEMVIRGLSQLRFSNSTSWDWNSWAGLRYDNAGTTIYLGGPAATGIFTQNATPPTVTVSFVGTNNVTSDSNFKAPIFYDSANTAYYLDPANTGTSLLVAGNVGIGNTSPSAKLHVLGASYTTASAANNNVRFEGGGGNGLGFGTIDATSTYASWIQSGYVPNFATATYALLLNPLGGNVGIGTTSPTVKLDIASTQANGIVMRYDTSTAYYAWIRPYWNSGTDTRIDFAINRTANVTPDVIMSVGYGSNVGIGTTSPGYKLDITGDARIASAAGAGALYFGTLDPSNIYLKLDNSYDLSLVQNAASGSGLYLAGAGNVYVSIDSNNNGTTDAFIVQNNAIKAGTELFRVQENGVVTASTDFRAPIFYDSNNTGYYLDPASTSNLVGLTVANTITGSITGSSVFVASLGSGLNYDIDRTTKRSGLSHYSGYSTGTNRPTTYDYTLQVTDGGKGWEISMDWISTAGPSIYARSLRDCCQNWSSWVRVLDSVNYAYAYNMNQNVRTTDNVAFANVTGAIFYDAANTAYYTDPASTSVLNRIDLPSGSAAINTTTPGTSAYQLNFTGQGTADNAQAITWGWSTSGAQAGIYVQSSGGYGTKMYIATTDSFATGSKTALTIDHTGIVTTNRNYLQATGSLRAPIFYDSDNTAYYIDAASTSVLNTATITTIQTNAIAKQTNGSPITINSGLNASTGLRVYYDMQLYNTLFFTTSGWGEEGRIYGSSSTVTIQAATATTTFVKYAGYSQEGGSFRAPIFYDSNDTTYYIDAASTSQLNQVASYYLRNLAAVSTDHQFGLYFNNSIDTAYAIYREGGAWTNPYPDLRIAFHTGIKIGANAGYNGIRFYDDYTMATQVMSINNSGDGLGANNVYVNNALQAGGSLRAPIFYDSNDTTYYVDPNSLSNIRHTIFHIGSNLVGATGVGVLFDGNYTTGQYRHRFRKYDDGAGLPLYIDYAHGTANSFTTIARFGGGGAYNPFSVYGTADASGDFRAPIFYDSNNTSYYLDPNSTTSLRTVGSWRSDSSTWDGEFSGKIQYHSNHWYFQAAGSWLFRNSAGSNVAEIDNSGNINGVGAFLSGNLQIRNSDPTITFRDTDHRTAFVHVNSNIFYVLTGGTDVAKGSWSQVANGRWPMELNLSNNNATFGGDVNAISLTAPIFYDANNTAYYCDPASTSNLNAITAAGNITAAQYYTGGWFRNNGSGNGLYNESTGEHFYSDAGDMWNVASANGTQGIRLRTGGHNGTIRGYFYGNDSNDIGLLNNGGNWRVRVVGGDYVLFDGSSARAQVFYDSNDTTYYTDPAGTSYLNYSIFNGLSSSDYTRQFAPSGGYFYEGGSVTGAIKIRLPANSKNLYPMLSFTCHIYNYGTGTSRTFKIGGHFSSSSWYNPFAYCLSESGSNLNVRWGYEGNYLVVWIGETSSGWSYPCVFITDFQNGYSAINNSWMVGWNVSRVTAFDTVTNGPTAAGFFWNQNNDGSGSGLDADLVDGLEVHTARNDNANKIVRTDSNGYIQAGWINTTSGDNGTNALDRIYASSDAYIRYYTPANFRTVLDVPTRAGSGASGSWGISITGNAATVSNGVYTNVNNTLTGINYFTSNLGTTSGSLSNPPLQAYASGTNAAFMSFHRGGSYAVNMGLDSDNVLRIGGWSASANRLQLDMSGNLTLAGVVDATQFRDSSNTAYYIDPASTSVLNKINLNSAGVAAIQWRAAGVGTIANGYPFYNNASYGSINIEVSDNDTGGLVIDNEGVTVYGAADNGQLFRTIDEDVYQANGNNVANATTFWINQGADGGGVIRGTFTSTGDFRAPIFYDSNNTAYYLDPASTSNLVGLTVANTITGSITGNAGGSSASCTGNAATATRTSGQSGYPHAGTGMFAFYNWGGSDGGTSAPSASTYTTGLSVGSNPGDQAYGFQIANNMWNTGLWTRNYNSGFGSWIRLLDSSNYVGYSAFTGNVDGTQFRDANNTAYYIDPASTSNLVGLTVANTITGAVSGNAGSVTINYNNDSNSTYQMLWGSGNNVYGTAGVYLNPSTDVLYANAFYDAGNTAYYLDPNSTSNLLLVKTRNTFGERIAVTAASSTTIDTQYNVTELTMSTNVSLTLSNIQSSGTVHMWTIVTVGNGTAYSIGWPAAIKWPGGTAPTITSTNTKRDIYQFVTYDGGTTIFAIIVGQNL